VSGAYMDIVGNVREASDDASRRCGRVVTGVGRSSALDQEDMCLLICYRTVFDAARNHVEFPRFERNDAVSRFDADTPLEHHEEVVRVFMGMPSEGALDLHDHDVVPIELAHGPGGPMLVEHLQLGLKIDGFQSVLQWVYWCLSRIVASTPTDALSEFKRTGCPSQSKFGLGLGSASPGPGHLHTCCR